MGNGPCCGQQTLPGIVPPTGGTNYGLHQNNYSGKPPTYQPPTQTPLTPTTPSSYSNPQQNVPNGSAVQNKGLMLPPTNPQFESNVSKYVHADGPPASYAKQAEGLPNLPEVVMKAIDTQRSRPLKPDNVCHGTKLPPFHLTEKNAFYDGEWKDGRPHGKGRVFYSDRGAYFEGEFRDGCAECSDGLFVYPDGTVYRGSVKNSLANGIGVLAYHNGEFKYEGNFLNDKPTGRGKETYKDGSTYEGSFMDGLKSGNGKYTWRDGTTYDGNFVNGYMEGYGVQTLPSGEIYKGNFKKNKRQGAGNMETKAGIYNGEFRNDKKEGNGQFRYRDGKIFRGEFKAGKPHGRGTIIFPNGQSSIGIWDNGENVSIEKIIGS